MVKLFIGQVLDLSSEGYYLKLQQISNGERSAK